MSGTWARTGIPAALTSATYDAANRIATWAGTTFSYDLNGNLTGDGTTTYTWNTRNQLSAMSGGTSASFVYDGLGRRRGKTISGTTTNFLYDGLNFVQELTSGGTPTANLLTGLAIDETFVRTDSGGAGTLLTDSLGSTLALANASGAVQTQYTFEPFGATTASGATSTNAAQFTGRENDGMGRYYYRARYYHSQLQRFLSEDPLGSRGSLNLFEYAINGPTQFVDPLGLKPKPGFGRPPNPSSKVPGGGDGPGTGPKDGPGSGPKPDDHDNEPNRCSGSSPLIRGGLGAYTIADGLAIATVGGFVIGAGVVAGVGLTEAGPAGYALIAAAVLPVIGGGAGLVGAGIIDSAHGVHEVVEAVRDFRRCR